MPKRKIIAKEWKVLTIDRHGDGIDSNFFESLKEAMHAAEIEERLLPYSDSSGNEIVALIIERVDWWFKNGPQDPDNRDFCETHLGERGDRDALRAGGWIG